MASERSEHQYTLLTDEPQEAAIDDASLIRRFKTYSSLIGGCCGIFVQLSTLGANFLLLAMWGEDAMVTRSPKEAMVFSLAWSFFTSCMALLVLALLRGLIGAVLEVTDKHHSNNAVRSDREALMMTIEVRYVVGALTGVCFAWTCTDLLLGMQSLAFYSLGTLVVALGWSKAMIWCFIPKPEDDEEQKPAIVHVV